MGEDTRQFTDKLDNIIRKMATDVAGMSTKLNDTHDDVIEVKGNVKKINSRVDKLESWRDEVGGGWKLIGKISLVLGVIGGIVGLLMYLNGCSSQRSVDDPAEINTEVRLMPPHENNKNFQKLQSLYQQTLTKKYTELATLAQGELKVLALFVDFSDNTHQVGVSYFDSLLFSPIGFSVRTYYGEISYGTLDLYTVNLPSTVGWVTASQPYDYYVNGQYGLYGGYPTNAQGLVSELVDIVDPFIDFSQYDNDGDGDLDLLIVVHAGPGAESSGSGGDIWSHKWAIPSKVRDGVTISDYTIEPEFIFSPGDMTRGVFCHELGHVWGLPDLYDTDYSSNGIGRWGLMGYGSWNGNNGKYPSYPSAWGRHFFKFAIPQIISESVSGLVIPPINDVPVIYKLLKPDNPKEYFLLENRAHRGSELGSAGAGLLVWHIHDEVFYNNWEWYPGKPDSLHLHVAIEQADGLFAIEKRLNRGDDGDPFPGSFQKTFFTPDPLTQPNSNWYESASNISLTNIHFSGEDIVLDIAFGDTPPPPPPPDTNPPPPPPPPDTENIYAPYGLTATYVFVDNQVNLVWLDSSDVGEWVHIWRKGKPHKGGWDNWELIDSTDWIGVVNMYKDTNMPDFQQVRYQVRNKYNGQTTGFSEEAKVFLR